jgi:hypothetical protein
MVVDRRRKRSVGLLQGVDFVVAESLPGSEDFDEWKDRWLYKVRG